MEMKDIPQNKDLTYLGLASYRDRNQLFGIKRKDRRQHVYILGKSGTGKSALMFNMIIQNIKNGDGVCMVDPHGENVEAVLSAVPPDRIKDVVYFNPADVDHHIGFNVLELEDSKYKHLVASGLMGIFTKIWANAWSARMEYILNNAILALLDTPGTTMLGIPRLLVDKDYRQKIISNLKDPVIKAFWIHEYEAWQDKFRNEAIAPIQNKVGQFLSTSIIRNVVGQSKSTINIFDIMNEGKIFLVNVSKGRIGEDNSALLGGMIITKIQLAAMERVRIPEDDRKDFYLYVDEFQNFVTDSFASILSEARKYRLNLTVAHQYTAQLVSDKSSAVRDAVFGNVGTMIIFRCGADDADFLEKEFDPEFTPQDIISLPNFKVYMKLMIDGITSRPFSAKTMPPMAKGDPRVEEEVIKSSREIYCRPKDIVEREINNWSGMSLGNNGDIANSNGEKFQAKCSICQKETFVPFKPEAGRPVYCKDCIAKIKAGELKPVKGTMNQIRHDEDKFFQPLADLGIEFEQKENGNIPNKQKVADNKNKKGIIGTIKKVFSPNKGQGQRTNQIKQISPRPKMGENLALRDILNKTLNENKILETKTEEKENIKIEKKPEETPSISLDSLKETKPINTISHLKDRSANNEEMGKLRAFIAEQTAQKHVDVVSEEPKTTGEVMTPISSLSQNVKTADLPNAKTENIQEEKKIQDNKIKEVPEEVLKKILE